MKNRIIFFFLMVASQWTCAQQLQLHYDLRHTVDPTRHPRNFPSLTFEYFKSNDSLGSFLFKLQTEFNGEGYNPSQAFLQVSKSLRYWKPKIYLALDYSGGLGIAQPSFGYAIYNSFGIGVSHPFQWKGAVLNIGVLYRYNLFPKGSHDAQVNFYFWKGFFNYRLQVSGSIVAWTQNRDLGTDFTRNRHGKKLAFFGDPQIWYQVWKRVSVGTKLNLFYHALSDEPVLQLYPTIGVRHQL